MAKPKRNLAAALASGAEKGPDTATQSRKAVSKAQAPSKSAEATQQRPGAREGKVSQSYWMRDEAKYQLAELRLRVSRERGQRVTVQDLMDEAVNDLFKKYGLAELA